MQRRRILSSVLRSAKRFGAPDTVTVRGAANRGNHHHRHDAGYTATGAVIRNSGTDTGCAPPSGKASRQERILSSLRELRDSRRITPETEWSTNPYELDRHGTGESYHRGYDQDHDNDNNEEELTPDVIVRPTTVDDVSAVLSFCNDHGIPVIPYGAGTSVEGHVCAVKTGTISLDMTAFDSIVLPGEEEDHGLDDDYNDNDDDGDGGAVFPDPIATVGAGVSRAALNEALRHTGLRFTVDPGAATATLGGMVATGASGTTAVRYGTMRENLLGLGCVLADGTVVRAGTRAPKSSAGYDLAGLLCGSEVRVPRLRCAA